MYSIGTLLIACLFYFPPNGFSKEHVIMAQYRYDKTYDVLLRWDEKNKDYIPVTEPSPKPIVPIEKQQAPERSIQLLPSATTTHINVETTYRDRAKGFQIATVPVAVAFGVGAVVVGTIGYAVPVFSILSLSIFWLAFLAWWLIGWVTHHLFSPDGVALVHALLGWHYLRREQSERFKRYRGYP